MNFFVLSTLLMLISTAVPAFANETVKESSSTSKEVKTTVKANDQAVTETKATNVVSEKQVKESTTAVGKTPPVPVTAPIPTGVTAVSTKPEVKVTSSETAKTATTTTVDTKSTEVKK